MNAWGWEEIWELLSLVPNSAQVPSLLTLHVRHRYSPGLYDENSDDLGVWDLILLSGSPTACLCVQGKVFNLIKVEMIILAGKGRHAWCTVSTQWMGCVINTSRSQSTSLGSTGCDLDTPDISQYNQLGSFLVLWFKRLPRWTIWERVREVLTGLHLHGKSDPGRNSSREQGALDLELQYYLASQGFSNTILWPKIVQSLSLFFNLQRKVFHSFSSYLFFEKKREVRQCCKCEGIIKEAN